jgi:hypothetical protein
VFPAGVARPNAANLNWVAGQPPVSNAVTTDISATGQVSFFNLAGTVDLTADVVGYYVDHNHDDRYALKPIGTSRLLLDPAAFRHDGTDTGFKHNFAEGRLEGLGSPLCVAAPVSLPQGARVTDVTAHVADNESGAGQDMVVKLWRNPVGPDVAELMFSATTTNFPGNITLTGTTITSPTVDNTAYSYFATACGLRDINFLYDMSIGYTNP